MKSKEPKEVSGVERMLKTKRTLVARLRRDIDEVKTRAAADVAKIESRIRVNATIIEALEKGKLKP